MLLGWSIVELRWVCDNNSFWSRRVRNYDWELYQGHSGKHRATTLMIVALGNWNPFLVENVGQVEGAGQTRLRCEKGKHCNLGAEQIRISHKAWIALPCSQTSSGTLCLNEAALLLPPAHIFHQMRISFSYEPICRIGWWYTNDWTQLHFWLTWGRVEVRVGFWQYFLDP